MASLAPVTLVLMSVILEQTFNDITVTTDISMIYKS